MCANYIYITRQPVFDRQQGDAGCGLPYRNAKRGGKACGPMPTGGVRVFIVFARGLRDGFARPAVPREMAAEGLESGPVEGAPALWGDTGGEKYDKLPPQAHIVEVDFRAIPGVMLKLQALRLSKFPALPDGEENESSEFFQYAPICKLGYGRLWFPDMAEFHKRCVEETNAIFKISGGRRK